MILKQVHELLTLNLIYNFSYYFGILMTIKQTFIKTSGFAISFLFSSLMLLLTACGPPTAPETLEDGVALWKARDISDYSMEMKITCFCPQEITRPVLVLVEKNKIIGITDLETKESISPDPERGFAWPTVTQLFDKLQEGRDSGQFIYEEYDARFGYPARAEIGTLANDAGIAYNISSLYPGNGYSDHSDFSSVPW